LVLDGVLTDAADGTLRFHPAAAPTDLEVACDGEGDNSANVRDGDVL
jgi:hypothetical protein